MVDRHRVDGEEGGGDGGQRAGEPVHVVEQVERIRDPDEPEDAEHDRERVVRDDVHREAGREHEGCRSHLGGELRERGQGAQVVDQAGDEDDAHAAEDPEELRAGMQAAGCERRADARPQSGKDADTAERRRLSLRPALAARKGDEPPPCGRAQTEPDEKRDDRESDDRGDRAHGAACSRVISGTGQSLTKRC